MNKERFIIKPYSTTANTLAVEDTRTKENVYINLEKSNCELYVKKRHIKDDFLKGDTNVECFSNLFHFIEYCFDNKLTPENSITFYDTSEAIMYIKQIKENNNE